MAELNLFLLRHGESAGNAGRVFATRKPDPPLTDTGVAQVTMQAEALSTVEFGAIYASPMQRARQSAAIVSARCGLPVQVCDKLTEVHVGVLDGQWIDAPGILDRYEQVVAQWGAGDAEAGFDLGETLSDVQRRFGAFLAGLDDAQERPVLVVAHGVLFMAAVWLWAENRLPKIKDNYMGRAHVTELRRKRAGKWRVARFNVSPEAALAGALQSVRAAE
jgi:broad specificity phosphatase PhoE